MTTGTLRADALFDRAHLARDLRGKTVRGGALTGATQIWRFAIGTGSTMVLARILVPEDFGVVALGVSIAGFAGVFRDMGLTSAVVQRETISREAVSTMFWINLAVAAAIVALLCACAPFIATLVDEDRLRSVIPLVGVSILLSAAGLMHWALLRRNLRNRDLAVVQIASAVLGSLCAIAAALMGAGYFSLLAGMIAGAAIPTAGYWMMTGWRPGLPRKSAEAASMLRYGGAVTGNAFLAYASRNADNLLIGGFAGSAALGIYSKAYGLLLLPLRQIQPPLSSVAIPALSSLQKDPAAYRSFYFRAVESVLFLTMPCVAFSFAAADEIVHIVLGPGWEEAAGIFRFLAPAAFAGTTWVVSAWAYQSLGHVGRSLKVAVVSTPILLAFFAVGSLWGAEEVAAALSIHSVLAVLPVIAICYKGTFLSVRDLLAAVWRPVTGSLLAGGVAWILPELAAPGLSTVPSLLLRAAAFLAVWFGFWLAIPSARARLRTFANLRSHFKRRTAPAEADAGAVQRQGG